MSIRGIYDDAQVDPTSNDPHDPPRRPMSQLMLDLQGGIIDQVWIALPLNAEERIRDLLTELRDHPVQVCFLPDIYSFNLLHHSFSEIAGLPVINLTDTPLQGWKALAKFMEDYVLSIVILVLASPLMLLISIVIKATSPGPVFYRQERVTWNGAYFSMLKFRSMPESSETTWPSTP